MRLKQGKIMLLTCPATERSTLKILCYYTNSTPKIQLIRVLDGHNCNYERVVFPQQRILFETTPEGRLEVYLERVGNSVLEQTFSCQNLPANQSPQKLAAI
jgi:hypothetical protein